MIIIISESKKVLSRPEPEESVCLLWMSGLLNLASRGCEWADLSRAGNSSAPCNGLV